MNRSLHPYLWFNDWIFPKERFNRTWYLLTKFLNWKSVWILTLVAGIGSCLLTKECSHFSGKVVWIFHKPDANIWVVHWFVNVRYQIFYSFNSFEFDSYRMSHTALVLNRMTHTALWYGAMIRSRSTKMIRSEILYAFLFYCTEGNSCSDRNNKTFPMMTIKASIIIGKARNKIPSTSLDEV